MKAPTLFDRILDFFRYGLKQYFCKHNIVRLYCKRSELFDGYGNYAGYCDKCGKDFGVIIEEEQNIS